MSCFKYQFLVMFQVVNIQVPFIFKHLVDHLNDPDNLLNITTPGNTIITVATSLVIGCKHVFSTQQVLLTLNMFHCP